MPTGVELRMRTVIVVILGLTFPFIQIGLVELT